MKVLLIYFTGTYSTLYITTLIKNQLLNQGYEVDVFPVTEKKKISAEDYDYIGIGYPIHCFNTPDIILRKVKRIGIKDKRFFIYKCGSKASKYNKASSYRLYKLLQDKNEFINEYHFLTPSNFVYKDDENFIAYAMQYNLKLVKHLCLNLNYRILSRNYPPPLQMPK